MSATAPADRTAALDRVDELVAGGLTVSKACAQVAEGLGVTAATVRSWRSRAGRVPPVAEQTDRAAQARAALATRAAIVLDKHGRLAEHWLDLAIGPDAEAKDATAANAAAGTFIDKMLKIGIVEAVADKHDHRVTVASPVDELRAHLDRLIPEQDDDEDTPDAEA